MASANRSTRSSSINSAIDLSDSSASGRLVRAVVKGQSSLVVACMGDGEWFEVITMRGNDVAAGPVDDMASLEDDARAVMVDSASGRLSGVSPLTRLDAADVSTRRQAVARFGAPRWLLRCGQQHLQQPRSTTWLSSSPRLILEWLSTV